MGFAERTFGLVECAAFCGPEDADFIGEDEGIDEYGIGLGVDDAIGAFDKILRSTFDFFRSYFCEF